MLEILDKFAGVKVLVVGDAMIDRYWWGDVSRISPEAPVPVVRLKEESLKPGGAANVAANVAALGAEARLIAAAGGDREGAEFPSLLAKASVNGDGLIFLKDQRTTVKTRIIAHNQHVVRLDSEMNFELSESESDKIFRSCEAHLGWASILIISDYAKGFLSKRLIKRLITSANEKGKLVLADPKGSDYSRYKNAGILTPNKFETAQATRIEITGDESLAAAASSLLENLSLQALLVTQGESGMTLFEKNARTVRFPATARSVYDVTGAGDTVIAALAVALAAGATLPAAVRIANAAAGLSVEEIGTSTVAFDKLKQTLATGSL